MDLTITTSGEGPLVPLCLTGRLGAATSGLVYDAVLATLGVDTVRDLDLDLDLTGLDHFYPAATSTLVPAIGPCTYAAAPCGWSTTGADQSGGCLALPASLPRPSPPLNS